MAPMTGLSTWRDGAAMKGAQGTNAVGVMLAGPVVLLRLSVCHATGVRAISRGLTVAGRSGLGLGPGLAQRADVCLFLIWWHGTACGI